MRYILCAVAFLAVAWFAYNVQPRSQIHSEVNVQTDFVLGEWYCCLLDPHPVRVYSPEVGGFGGRSGRPVTD